MYEVDQKSLDVRAILILICHDHDVAISQAFKVFFSRILFVVLETYDLDKIVDLGIFKNLQSHTQTHTIKFHTELEVGNFFQNNALFVWRLSKCM